MMFVEHGGMPPTPSPGVPRSPRPERQMGKQRWVFPSPPSLRRSPPRLTSPPCRRSFPSPPLTKKYASGPRRARRGRSHDRQGARFSRCWGRMGPGKTTLIRGRLRHRLRRLPGRVSGRRPRPSRAEYRAGAPRRWGLVPQEDRARHILERLEDGALQPRPVSGRRADDHYLEQLLRDLSLWGENATAAS